MKVLIVDDDSELLDITSYALQRHGYSVVTASDGATAIRRWEHDRPDVLVLDIGLPRSDGLQVCQKIRETEADVPIIMLTARHEDDDVERGFKAGADDYVTKPFSHRQLALRIQALLRRRSPTAQAREPVGELKVCGLTLDMQSHEVTRNGVTAHLTPIEFRILHMLALNAGRVVATGRLAEYAWGYEGGDASLLKIHIYHIRQKLRMRKDEPGSIKSVPWVGYLLTEG